MTTAKEITARIAAAAAEGARRRPTVPTFEMYAPEGADAPAIDWTEIATREWELLDADVQLDGDDEYHPYAMLAPRRPRPTLFDYADPTGEFTGVLTVDFAPGNAAYPYGWENNGGVRYAKYETADGAEYHWTLPDGAV